jgi:hypothetical protein
MCELRLRPMHTAYVWMPNAHNSSLTGCACSCQYAASGLVAFQGRSLTYRGVALSTPLLEHPEGITFAHGQLYAQDNWGTVIRCDAGGCTHGRIRQVAGASHELVTWAIVAGPDGALYASADKQYSSRVYTQPPPASNAPTGCVLRLAVSGPEGAVAPQPPQQWSRTPMRRPSGLRWGPLCGTLFVASMDPGVMRYSGPAHTAPGTLLARIDVHPAGLLPWDVAVVHGDTLVVTTHRHRWVCAWCCVAAVPGSTSNTT